MDRVPVGALSTAVVALAAGLAGLAASYAVAGRTPEFVAAPISAFVVAVTPGALITFSITVLGDLGTQLALVMSLALTVAVLGVVAGAGYLLARELVNGEPLAGPVGTAALVTGVGYVLTTAPVSSLAAGLGAGGVFAVAVGASMLGESERRGVVPSAARRNVLGSVATALGIGVAGYYFGNRVTAETDAVADLDGSGDVATGDGDGVAAGSASVDELLGMAEERSLDVEGIEPLVSEDFYNVDINQIDPKVDGEQWTLSVTGAVAEEKEYTYEDVTSRERQHQFVTLRCVGEDLNGHKMDNALWTGIPIWDLVEPADPSGKYVMFRAADGFFEEFPIEALKSGFLAFGMNGKALPRKHGRPARALIPGHWGEINVKWITEIEILEKEADGYWEQRGWHGTGPVNTVAKLHAINHLDDGRIEVGGHAYAGTRGIEKVEVSVDGGETWTEAELSEPLPGRDVWRQWVYRYEKSGEHDVVVRATDGTGTLQPKERMGAFPSGATGWVARHVENG